MALAPHRLQCYSKLYTKVCIVPKVWNKKAKGTTKAILYEPTINLTQYIFINISVLDLNLDGFTGKHQNLQIGK